MHAAKRKHKSKRPVHQNIKFDLIGTTKIQNNGQLCIKRIISFTPCVMNIKGFTKEALFVDLSELMDNNATMPRTLHIKAVKASC
jgi:hypothetical protein